MKIQLSDHFTMRRIVRFTLPSIIMMVVTSIYSVVDGLFVANFVGSNALASINIMMPMFLILGAFGFMLGSGGSAVVFGAEDLLLHRRVAVKLLRAGRAPEEGVGASGEKKGGRFELIRFEPSFWIVQIL